MKFFWLGLALVFLCLLIAGFFWYQRSLKPTGVDTLITFVIDSGEPANNILKRLSEQKIIRSYVSGRIYHKLNPTVFKPGIYYLKSETLPEVFNQLGKGPKDIKVTFPEGWRREQYAARLQNIFPDFDTETFLKLTASMEGRLFPDTYYFPANPSPEKVVTIISQNFAKKSSLSADQADTLIIASLVERESNNPADSGLISGIIHKRLKNGWPLQIDATVQYAKDTQNCQNRVLTCDYWKPIYDTKFESPYSTYLYTGLPPAPIASPGLNSINAALNPVISDYWYYLTGNDGKTYFSKDLAAHQLLIDTKLNP